MHQRWTIVASVFALSISLPVAAGAQQKNSPPQRVNPVALDAKQAADAGEAVAESGDKARLQGKWIVRFVKRDGKPNAAQIGQQLGDIITIKNDGQQLGFG